MAQKKLNLIIIGILVCLALLPILRVTFFLSTTGANNPANDDIDLIHLMDRILNGAYPWQNFFKDTFYSSAYRPSSRGHSDALPILLQILLAFFSDQNLYVITLYIGIGLALFKLFLLLDLFTYPHQGLGKWLLLPPLSFLVFSPSQISTYEFGYASLEQGFCQLGLIFGIWGLTRFKDRWPGIVFMAMGGMVASWSWGGGPLVWPVFLLGMWGLNFQRPMAYLICLGAGLLATSPYFYFLLFKYDSNQGFPISSSIVSFFNYRFIIKGIGWPLAQGFSQKHAYVGGLAGLLLLISVLIIFFAKRSKLEISTSAPSLMLLAFSLLNIYQISLFREILVPWYASPFMLFWVGLMGLAYVHLVNPPNQLRDGQPTKFTKTELVWSLAVIVCLAFLYGQSNFTLADKVSYIRSRSPAAASCLRNYPNAPSYCELAIFQWEPENTFLAAQLAQPLEKHRLSVFAPNQRWTLQGDFILNTVNLQKHAGFPDIIWSADLSSNRVPFSDYQRLNLFLPSPNSVEWTVSIPPNIKRAEFKSAVAISRSAPKDPNADGVVLVVGVEPEGKPGKVVYSQYLAPGEQKWHPFNIPLTKYSGTTIKIHLGSDAGQNPISDYAMFRYPSIEVEMEPQANPDKKPNQSIQPSNTELSPMFPKTTPDDWKLTAEDPSIWKTRNIEKIPNPEENTSWLVGEDPQLEYNDALDLCLSDYSHFYVKMAASPEIRYRMLQIFYLLKDQAGFDEKQSVKIPLLADGEMHEYTYELKLLELPLQARLTGIRLDPVVKGANTGDNLVKISDIRLIRKDQPTLCL